MTKTVEKDPDFTNDEYWGKGGRYVVNLVTGKREPAPAVEEAAAAIPAQIGQRPDDAAPGTQISPQGGSRDSQGLAPIKPVPELAPDPITKSGKDW